MQLISKCNAKITVQQKKLSDKTPALCVNVIGTEEEEQVDTSSKYIY